MRFKDVYLMNEETVHIELSDANGKEVIGTLNDNDPKTQDIISKIKKLVGGVGIKDAFAPLYQNKPMKSKFDAEVGQLVGKSIRTHLKGSLDALVKVFGQKFPLKDEKFTIPYNSSIIDANFYKDLFKSGIDKMGPGEIMLWAMFSNISFNDGVGDLFIDTNKKLELKGFNGFIGTNMSSSFKNWTMCKEKLVDFFKTVKFTDADKLLAPAGLGIANGQHLFDLIQQIKSNKQQLETLAKILVNVISEESTFAKEFANDLAKSTDVKKMLYTIMACHFKAYQKFDDFQVIGILSKEVPAAHILLINPSIHSINDLASFLEKNGLGVGGGWQKDRNGGYRLGS